MVRILYGQILKQEFLKDQFLALFFLIYIKDLSENLVSNPKLFADNTVSLSVFQGIALSAKNFNNDLKKINKWHVSEK